MDDAMKRAAEAGARARLEERFKLLIPSDASLVVRSERENSIAWQQAIQTAEAVIRAALPVIRAEIKLTIADQRQQFLSPEYACPQPMGSFSERFALDEAEKAISARLAEMEG